jgi:hypothetical protein
MVSKIKTIKKMEYKTIDNADQFSLHISHKKVKRRNSHLISLNNYDTFEEECIGCNCRSGELIF